MAKQSNRPTATNYQDYLLDYSGVDLSRYRGQVEESPEAAVARAYNERHPDRPIRPEEIGQGGVLSDMGHAVAAGLNELAALPFWGAQQVADRLQWDGVARLAGDAKAYFQESAEAKRKGYSADMKLAQEKEFITYDKEKGYGLGTAWSDPRAVLGSVGESLPGMAAGMGAGAVVAKGLMGLGLSRGLAWGIGSAAGEGGVSGGQNSMGAYDAVMAMPEESLRRSPEYVELLRSLRDPAEARETLAHDVALLVGGQTAAATGSLAAGPGAMFGRMLGGETGKTLARSVLKMGTAESAEEALQSGAEEYLSQRQIQRADPTIEPMAGVPNAMVEGALAGGLMGGGMGIPGHYRGRAQAAAQPPAPEADGQETGQATTEGDGAMPDGAPVAEAAADGDPDRIVPDAGRMERGEHVDLLREDGGPLPAMDRTAEAGPAPREESAGEASPPVEGADSLSERSDALVLPPVPGGLTEAVPVPEAGGMPQEPGRALPLSAQMRTTDAAQGVPPADREGQAGAGQAVVPERPAPLGPPQDMRPGERPAGMRPAMPEAATPAMPEVLPNILPQSGPEVGPGAAVPPQAETGLPATAPVATPAPSAEARPGPDVSQLGRGELLHLLPEEQRAAARRMTTPRIRELVRQAAQQPLPAGESRILSAEEVHHAQENGSGRRQSAAGPGMGQGDGGTGIHAAAEYAGRQGREGDGTGAAGHAAEGDGRGRTLIKIPQRDDEPARFALMEADEVQASHLPESSFQRNPRYGLENERRYHDEPASRQKVLENAARLDPAFLLESVDAAHGAPIVDRQGNVLGGNGRAMSIRQAYEKFPDRAEAYRAALRSQAERLGIDPQLVGALRRPVLVRRLERDHSREVRQQLVSALNDSFTDRKESRAAGKSRGARLSVRTLDALASGLREADSLRQYFDTPASAAVVEMLVSDGVLQRTERNAFIGPDGLLNPDGKRLVEEALRGRVAGSYEALAAMPGQILAKIDAAIPHLLIAENVGGAWDITRHLRDAIDLLAEYRAAGAQDAELFLARTDMLREGKAPSERYSQAAQQLFRMAIGMKKAEFVGAFARYAAHAKASPEAGGMPGATLPQAKAAETFLGILPKRDKAADKAVERTADAPVHGGNDTGQDTQEAEHVEQHPGGDLERHSGDGNAQDRVGEEALPADGAGDGAGGREGGGRAGKELAAGGGEGLSGHAAPAAGTGGPAAVDAQTSGARRGPAGSEQSGGSRGHGGHGLDVRRDGEAATAGAAARSDDGVTEEDAHLRAIRRALPGLYPGQQEDVAFAERRFGAGQGVLFTNGTGTGKTGLGLGIIKRLVAAGRENILIAVPADKIGTDWGQLGERLGVETSKLADTRDAGKGVTITTHANMAQNDALFSREWDLIVIDEAHKLSSGKNGDSTALLERLRGLALHPRGVRVRAERTGRGVELMRELSRLRERRSAEKRLSREEEAREEELSRQFREWQEEVARTVAEARRGNRADLAHDGSGMPGVLLLSATPFAYEKSVDYAEGLLFDYPQRERKGYNDPDGHGAFMMEHFGYRMRYGKLTQPEADVDSALMQRQFNSWLKRQGALSSRNLDTPFDYDRRFVLTENAIGQKIDEGLAFLRDNRDRYEELHEHLNSAFDHLARRYLLEAIKARDAVGLIREHRRLGRKVVVFHQFNKGGGFHPFDVGGISPAMGEKLHAQARDFAAERPDLVDLPLKDLASPVETLKQAFPDARVFSGLVSRKDREAAVREFQRDDGGADIIIVQADAGEAGLSLHDTTGKHQRVLINLGLPTKPVTAIQQEGRIFRAGQKSNALFRYLNTGTNWERAAFAQTIAQRASAAENLAMGEEARGLKEAFIQAFEDSGPADVGGEGEGTGGKARDRALQTAVSEFDRAKSLYFAQQKKTARTRSREGEDYFATPEPLGQKMVEWARIEPGSDVLEPSAGHGAIARWFPESARRTVVEPSAELASRLMLATDARVRQHTFEKLDLVNKYDSIVMNPPFGTAGKTAMAHLEKAFRHLRAGGRLVAVVPDGPSMDKRLAAFLAPDEKAQLVPVLRREIGLPAVTFTRAGTQVRCKVLVIDAARRGDLARRTPPAADAVSLEAGTVGELFDRLEDISAPARLGKEGRDETRPLASLGTPERRPDSTPVKVVEVEPGSVPEFKKARELAAWLKAYFAGRREETILSTGKRVRFGNGNLEASLKRGREGAHNQAYAALHDLVRQAEYDSFEGRDARHPHLGGQEVYYSALRIGDKLYAVKMKFDIPSDKESSYRKDILKEKDIEELRYKDHSLREMEIAPVLYREPARNTTGFTQTTGAIDAVSLGVLRDAVKPTRLEEGALSSVQAAGRHLPPPRDVFRSPGEEAIRKAVEALNQRAVHAADVRVVEDMRDLPAGLREAFAAQTGRVEGMYDPVTDTVWLVAGNLESVERAVEVWAHENLVHHGLRAVFTPQQRRVLLNQLWQATGGMGNDMVRTIARRYGKDPRGNEADRLLVMEEVLARLAERRARGLLTEQETGWWRKVVQAVLRAWKKLVQSVSGREGRMDAARMERLLDALQGHVMDGRSARTAEMLEEDGPLASLPAVKREKAHAAWEQVRKDTEAWERQVEEVAAGRGDRFKALRVGATPDVLVRLGARQLPMQMEQRNLKKILSKHSIPLETLRDLPAQLASPLMVFKSATMADAYVVLTEMERDGENLVAAVHFDVTAGRIHVNDVASIHDRSVDRDGKKIPGWVWIRNQIEKGNLRYYDTTRSPRWFRERAGLQLSSVVNHGGYRGIRILTDKDVVKPVQPPLPSLADKEKSLAWARTNRLQLPQVRRLPARLSVKKILDETDVVKPIAPEADGPLASLSEEVASGVRVLRGIMGRGVSEDVADILANREMGRLVPSQDMGLLERLFKLPHWVAKEHAGFAAVYERQLKRVEERSAALKQALETLPLLFDPDAGKRLRGKELEELAALIWKWDGKPIPALKGVDKFLVREKLPNGRALLRTNPAYRERFREWLRDEPGAERVKQGFLQVRDALDEAFVRAYNRMAGMADLAETDLELYRTEFGSLHNYFPHQRRGRYYVAASRDGETVFRKHFDVPPGSSVREEWARIVAAHRKEHPGAHWAPPREAEKLPDDILGAPIDPQAMEQIIMAAARRLGGDAKQTAQVRETLLAGVADILKARGFGAHGIRRQHIPGFETEDIKGVLHAYLAGLNGWLTKMDAAADFAQALGRIDAVKTPRLWEYASQYSKDMLRNSDRIDRITGNIKTVAFAWYLGGNIKTAVVNLTQNLIVGIPRLERYVTGGGGYWLKSAADTIGLRYSGKGLRGARGLSPEEADMLQELYGNNVITDAYMDEIRGQIASSPSLRLWERFVRLLGKPMSMVEVFNRASLALAAYRAARRGAFKAGAAAELGLAPGRKMTHEQARDFAAMLVRDTHFEYGRGNQPEFLRSNTAGRLLSPLFTFRSFGANILNLWWLALRHEGREGRAFVARSLAATVALGGLTAFPFYATLSALCTAASGDDEDWTTKIRQALPQDDLLRDVVCYGLPAVAGVNIGGSLRMETPFTEGMRRGGTFKEAMTESLGALLGIPYDLAVNKPSRALEAHRFGEDAKAVEALVPTFMANLMQAWRLATEGQTTLRGRPLNRPGQPGARRLTPAEAVGKALGFQPTSSAKSFAAYAADKLRTQVRSDRIDIFVNQALDDLDSKGRPYMMRELRKRLTAWNAEMEAAGRTDRKIQPKDVLRRVASRRRQNRPTPMQREKGAAQLALWGV